MGDDLKEIVGEGGEGGDVLLVEGMEDLLLVLFKCSDVSLVSGECGEKLLDLGEGSDVLLTEAGGSDVFSSLPHTLSFLSGLELSASLKT